MSIREDQSSSLVSLHQGMRLPDKQTRYRQAGKQTSKITRKITKFLDLGAQKHRQRNVARLLHFRLSLRRKRRLSAAQRRSAISPSQRMKFSAEIFNFAHYRRTKFSSISRQLRTLLNPVDEQSERVRMLLLSRDLSDQRCFFNEYQLPFNIIAEYQLVLAAL